MQAPAAVQTSWQIVVMGVSGCGKTTVATQLAQRLGLRMIDGDDLHLPENVAKMRSGTPLQDEDRWPWLERIGQSLVQPASGQHGTVVACSALKRAYRDRIRQQAPQVRFVFLDGSAETIRQRLDARVGHYMPPGLLQSQLNTLQRPEADETDVVTVSLEAPVEQLSVQAIAALQPRPIS